MPERRSEWARPVIHYDDDPTYHWVTFEPGPTTRHEATAACGLTARWWPRLGIRMTDRHCEACLAVCSVAWRASPVAT